MNIFDLGLGERLSEGILAELGMPSRARELPHVGQRRDLIAFEKPEVESCAVIRPAFGPRSATVTRDDPLDDGQPDAGAFKFTRRMEPLKNAKKFIGILRIEPDAIITNEEDRFQRSISGADFDPRLGTSAGVFQ